MVLERVRTPLKIINKLGASSLYKEGALWACASNGAATEMIKYQEKRIQNKTHSKNMNFLFVIK